MSLNATLKRSLKQE